MACHLLEEFCVEKTVHGAHREALDRKRLKALGECTDGGKQAGKQLSKVIH